MNRAKYWVGGAIVLVALGYLAISGANKNMVTYLTVGEVMAHPEQAQATGVRVVGNVEEGSIQATASREVWFNVVHEGNTLRACYRGAVPDTFKDGAEVVLEGKMNDRGEFHATTLLAKCPSKYEAEKSGTEAASAGSGYSGA